MSEKRELTFSGVTQASTTCVGSSKRRSQHEPRKLAASAQSPSYGRFSALLHLCSGALPKGAWSRQNLAAKLQVSLRCSHVLSVHDFGVGVVGKRRIASIKFERVGLEWSKWRTSTKNSLGLVLEHYVMDKGVRAVCKREMRCDPQGILLCEASANSLDEPELG